MPWGSFASILLLAAVLAAAWVRPHGLPEALVAVPAGTPAVLAVLIGVNIGPNLTYTGSLATLPWRRVVNDHGLTPSLRRFTSVGLLTVPAAVVVAICALWLSVLLLPFA